MIMYRASTAQEKMLLDWHYFCWASLLVLKPDNAYFNPFGAVFLSVLPLGKLPQQILLVVRRLLSSGQPLSTAQSSWLSARSPQLQAASHWPLLSACSRVPPRRSYLKLHGISNLFLSAAVSWTLVAANSICNAASACWLLQIAMLPAGSWTLVCLGRSFRRKRTSSLDILTTKKVPRGFYKGKNCKPTGFHTRKGGYVIVQEKLPNYVVPDLTDFKSSVVKGALKP
ncbi:hypothetical protein KY290_022381 [Solanum tuberosum]|uniref:Uncharacterized protein n=1 Tax=Solanum tuberosum TaxID=4113 RepID=A0ABQ7V6A1_SOLTU|nr:hypothetical protein KY290_022381 [Solanum tuberosum]